MDVQAFVRYSYRQREGGQQRFPCPFCEDPQRVRNFCIGPDKEGKALLWMCQKCEESGRVALTPSELSPSKKSIRKPMEAAPALEAIPPAEPIPTRSMALSVAAEGYFLTRGISPETLAKCGVVGDEQSVAFPYRDQHGRITAFKYRGIQEKKFWQKGVCETWWNKPDKLSGDDLTIVEGECDLLALVEVGIMDVMSIPNGAPQKVSNNKVDPSEDGKFRYVWTAKDLFQSAKRVILFTDADEPGKALAEELARRIGKARCWRVVHPAGCKDANDVLLKHGPQALRDLIANAEPWPINGIHTADFYAKAVDDLYTKGTCGGVSTGIQCVDDIYTMAPGMLTVVTGTPGSGKSSVFDQIMMNVAQRENWKCAVASFENPQAIHIAKLSSILTGKPFFDGPSPKMTKAEMDSSVAWLNDRFFFLDGDGGLPTIEDVIQRLEMAVMRWGIRVAIIDPFSYLARDKGMAEHEWVGYALSLCKQWALAHDAHIICVAHPQKMMRREDGTTSVPGGYEISGSAAYFNKADVGLTVARNTDGSGLNIVKCWKSRFPWIGSVGQVDVLYEAVSGRFLDPASAPAPKPRIIYSAYTPVDAAIPEIEEVPVMRRVPF